MANETRMTVMDSVFASYPKVIEKVRGDFYFSGIVEIGKNLVDLEIKAFEIEEIKNLKKYVKNKKLDAIVLIYDICRKRISNKDFNPMINEINNLPSEVLRASVGVQLVEKVVLNEEDEKKIAESIKAPQYKIDFAKSEDRCYKSLASPFVELVKNVLEKRNKQYGENIKEQVAELEEKKKEEEMKEQKDKLEGKEEDLSNTEKVTVFLLGKGEDELDYAKYWIIKFAFSDTPELVIKKAENGLEARFNYLSKKILLKIIYSKGNDIKEIRQTKNPPLDFGVCFAYDISTKAEFPRYDYFKKYLNLIKEKNEFFSHAVKVLIGVRLSESVNLHNEFSDEISKTIKATNYRFDFRNEKSVGFLTKCFIDIARKIVNNRKSKGPLLKANLAKKTGKKDETKNKETEKKKEVKEKEEAKVTKINSEGKKGEEDIIKAQTSKSEKEKKQEKEKEKNGDNINGKINEEKKQEKEKEKNGDNIDGK